MDKTVSAPRTQHQINETVMNPASVLILHGSVGVGKLKQALTLSQKLLNITSPVQAYPYFYLVEPDEGKISIDEIREVQSQLINKVPGEADIRRIVIIHGSEFLTLDAQNALLKTLEEVPSDTVIILCTTSLEKLLPTVVSRGTAIQILPLDEARAFRHFGDNPDTQKAFLMSSGRAELMQALIDDQDHEFRKSMEQAKAILSSTSYERLLEVNNLIKDKEVVYRLLEAMMLICKASARLAAQKNQTEQQKRWQSIRKQVNSADKDLRNKAGTKLVLTDLFLHL